ncbi:MAG: TVP38/TMEM64 family protein [Acetivibrionales bacterium]
MDDKSDRMDNSKTLKLTLNIVSILIFLAFLVFLGMQFGPAITGLVEDPGRLSRELNSLGWRGVLVFLGLQALQVLIAVIPGGVVQVAGGYIYGTWLGLLYSVIGILLGSLVVFFAARLLGYPLVKMLVSPGNLEKLSFMINSSKSEIAMLILFLIPGMPKDVLTYIAGITPVKPVRFFTVSIIGRLPALLGSSILGYSTQTGNFTAVILLSAASVVFFLIGLFFKDKIIRKIQAGKR